MQLAYSQGNSIFVKKSSALAIKKLVCSNNHLSHLDLDYGLDHSEGV